MILHELNKTNSRLDKECILNSEATEGDKIMFMYAYNPYKMYNLKFSDIDYSSVKPICEEDAMVLDTLLGKVVTGNTARGIVLTHCQKYGDLVKLICNKDLACGVTATTLNKVFGKDFIPEFKVQLATDMPLDKITWPKVCQIKYNGTRVIALIDSYKNVTFKTRNGHQFEFPKLAKMLQDLPIESRMLDGELCFGDSCGTDHTKVSGIVNSAIKGTPIDNPDLVYNIFDTMTLHEFYNQSCPYTYDYRFKQVKTLIHQTKQINIARTWIIESLEDLEKQFAKVLEKGYEGFILKDWSHTYKYKRTRDWLKIKDEKTADLECIGIVDGTGKYEDMIGSLLCEGEIDGKYILVRVGTGLSDADRSRWASDYLGKKIEVGFNTVIQDKKTGDWSLFLPRFITIRGDL